MKCVLICCSPFGNAVSDYFKYLGRSFNELNYKVIYIFDGRIEEVDNQDCFYSWPSKRPTKFKDFVFLSKVLKKYKPEICISNFGSTNVVGIVSFFYRIKYRLNYVHTTQVQIQHDSNYSKIKTNLLRFRKNLVYNLYTHLLTNSNGTKKDILKHFLFEKKYIHVFPLLIEGTKKNIFESKKVT